MKFNLYRFELQKKQGILLETPDGRFSEVSPLEGRSRESLQDALEQLHAIRSGWTGPLLPSVAFGLYGLGAPAPEKVPCALFLSGTPEEVLSTAKNPHGCTTAKIKVGSWNLSTTLSVLKALPFRLRIDFNLLWTPSDVHALCRHLSPSQIDFLEDPGCLVENFTLAGDTTSAPLTIWKPMVRGLPIPTHPVILSSAFESSIGLRNIASLLSTHQIPSHTLGIGTLFEDDIVSNPAFLQDGKLHFPSSWNLKQGRLIRC